jgi:hypothetical protein
VIGPLSSVSVALSVTRVFVEPAEPSFNAGVTVRGAATFAHPDGMTGVGGKQVLSVRLEGSQVPMTLPLDEPPPLDDPLLPEDPPLLDDPALLEEPLLPEEPLPLDAPPLLEEPPLPEELPPLEEPPLLDTPPLLVLEVPPLPEEPPVLDVPLLPEEPPLPPEFDGGPESEEPHALIGRNATAERIPTYAMPRNDMTDSSSVRMSHSTDAVACARTLDVAATS